MYKYMITYQATGSTSATIEHMTSDKMSKVVDSFELQGLSIISVVRTGKIGHQL
jgi:uncharacterized protein (DUF302 family)